jgi:hypothetical protein
MSFESSCHNKSIKVLFNNANKYQLMPQCFDKVEIYRNQLINSRNMSRNNEIDKNSK